MTNEVSKPIGDGYPNRQQRRAIHRASRQIQGLVQKLPDLIAITVVGAAVITVFEKVTKDEGRVGENIEDAFITTAAHCCSQPCPSDLGASHHELATVSVGDEEVVGRDMKVALASIFKLFEKLVDRGSDLRLRHQRVHRNRQVQLRHLDRARDVAGLRQNPKGHGRPKTTGPTRYATQER